MNGFDGAHKNEVLQLIYEVPLLGVDELRLEPSSGHGYFTSQRVAIA